MDAGTRLSDNVIRVSAVVIRDPAGRVLTVRKRDTDSFMFPGGKPELSETAARAAIRECREELRIDIDESCLHELGVVRTPAANEPGFDVVATVFVYAPPIDPAVYPVQPAAEIVELRWQATDGDFPDDVAPLTVHVLSSTDSGLTDGGALFAG